ncbi:unnamed protein product [Spirodela intermedia]|uniref:Uncharacterized protein n=1 Tax=Spirodela intermedia TaxID=51605 RepID=A0A7I8JZM8_SPIIN|nr:unnamed protein product [Spirodela intermedia]
MEGLGELEIVLMSAEGGLLKRQVELFTDIALVTDDAILASERSPMASAGSDGFNWNPTRGFSVRFPVLRDCLGSQKLRFVFWCVFSGGDILAGQAEVPLAGLLEMSSSSAGPLFLSTEIKRPGGGDCGAVTFSYEYQERPSPLNAGIAVGVPAYKPAAEQMFHPSWIIWLVGGSVAVGFFRDLFSSRAPPTGREQTVILYDLRCPAPATGTSSTGAGLLFFAFVLYLISRALRDRRNA